ncbi:MAG: hypothetical protein E7672_02315 [Ruminococcaceae bacterium]|nr:hypothetical protein [Oscillospiraceae bacterium]
MTTKETSAYIKGLLDGSNLDTTTPEGKIIAALVDLCGAMAAEIETLTEEVDICNQYIEEIDEDLGAVEEIVYDDECDCDCDDDDCDCCDCDCDDDDCDCCCGCDDDDDDDEEFYCAMCPGCGNKIYFDDTVAPEDIICPNCQKPLVEDEENEDL